MKKVLLFIAVALMATNLTFGQAKSQSVKQKYSPETIAMMRADKLEKELTLTAAEKKALVTLFTKQENDRRAKMEANQKEAKATKEKNDAELKKILGEERFAEYAKQREENIKARMENKGHEGKAGCCSSGK